MKKSVKKLVSTFMSMTLAATSLSLGSVFAFDEDFEGIWFNYEGGINTTKEAEEKYDSVYNNITEFIDDGIFEPFGGAIGETINPVKLWAKDDEKCNFNTRLFIMENQNSDYIAISLKKSYSGIEEKFSEYNEYLDITAPDDSHISIVFKSDNHKLNYQTGRKILSELNKDLTVSSCYVHIGVTPFFQVRVIAPGAAYSSEFQEERTEMILNKISENADKIDVLNKDLADNGIRVRHLKADEVEIEPIKETYDIYKDFVIKYVEYPEDITAKEFLEYTKFMKENYNLKSDYSGYSVKTASSIFEFNRNYDEWLDGDANEDGSTNIADATAIVQAIGNPDKYALTDQGYFNADTNGDGLTGLDALAIQVKLTSK